MTQMTTDEGQKDPQTYRIIGAAIEVHRQLGHGFLEAVYREGLAVELAERGIPFSQELDLPVYYKGKLLPCSYRADFICFGEVIVELKALGELSGTEEAQIINYLKASGLSRGLLLNFGTPRLQHKRFVFSHLRSSASSADES